MQNIMLLPKEISEVIAAGEVVDRPASVVKELVENSIDAGASSVTVEIKNGGVSFIRITDNGTGINSADVRTAFLRHATSKIKSKDDLENIHTLGFRGEALASVSAVAKIEVLTKSESEEVGTRYVIEGSEEVLFEQVGCPDGTTILIRDIFYNTPARLKFLKTDNSEGNAVVNIMEKIALSNPKVRFNVIKEGREVMFTSGNGKMLDCINAVLGRIFANTVMEINYNDAPYSVSGFITKPEACKATRAMQHFFINGRYFKSILCSTALGDGYKNSIMIGKFPGCVIFINTPYNFVDVNVHPTKTEVRFTDERKIFSLIYFAVKSALNSTPKPEINFSVKRVEPQVEPIQEQTKFEFAPQSYTPAPKPVYSSNTLQVETPKVDIYKEELPVSSVVKMEKEVSVPETIEIPEIKVHTEPEPVVDSNIRTLGEAFGTYILAQIDSEILIIDKHAAHERYYFNELKKSVETKDRQILLSPETVSLQKREYAVVLENLEKFESLGFLVEDFGFGTIVVREVPTIFADRNIALITEEIAENIATNKHCFEPEYFDDLLHSVACKAAVKGNNYTSEIEQQSIINMVLGYKDIKYCPHGRPVAFTLSKNELEKQFGRS